MDKGKIPFNIYVDLSKAFDTLDHEILLYKLDYYGIKVSAISLLRSYLTNCKQYVEFSHTKSEISELKSLGDQFLDPFYLYKRQPIIQYNHIMICADDTTLTSN